MRVRSALDRTPVRGCRRLTTLWGLHIEFAPAAWYSRGIASQAHNDRDRNRRPCEWADFEADMPAMVSTKVILLAMRKIGGGEGSMGARQGGEGSGKRVKDEENVKA